MIDIHCPFCQSTNWRPSGDKMECRDCQCLFTMHDILSMESTIYRIAYGAGMSVFKDHDKSVKFAEFKHRMQIDPQPSPYPPDSYFEAETETAAEKERKREWQIWQRER